MTQGHTKTTRAERLRMPLARDVVRDLAIEHGGCIRPVQLRRTDTATGQVDQVLVPCGHTLASVCSPCAERAKSLRAAQCREGWHLDHEPVTEPNAPTETQRWWVEQRANVQAERDDAEQVGQDTADLDAAIPELDEEITCAGMRGKVLPAGPLAVTARPVAVRMPRTCRGGRLTRARSARSSPHRTARPSGRRCSSR